MAQSVKNPPAMRETLVRSLGQEYPLEEKMTTHSNILGWENIMGCSCPWGSQKVGPDLAAKPPPLLILLPVGRGPISCIILYDCPGQF